MEPSLRFFRLLPFMTIRVEQGRWDDNGQPMAASQVVFAANRLTAQDLILISSNISGEQPNLRLTLQSEAAESRSYFIRQNDENGSISLTEGRQASRGRAGE